MKVGREKRRNPRTQEERETRRVSVWGKQHLPSMLSLPMLRVVGLASRASREEARKRRLIAVERRKSGSRRPLISRSRVASPGHHTRLPPLTLACLFSLRGSDVAAEQQQQWRQQEQASQRGSACVRTRAREQERGSRGESPCDLFPGKRRSRIASFSLLLLLLLLLPLSFFPLPLSCCSCCLMRSPLLRSLPGDLASSSRLLLLQLMLLLLLLLQPLMREARVEVEAAAYAVRRTRARESACGCGFCALLLPLAACVTADALYPCSLLPLREACSAIRCMRSHLQQATLACHTSPGKERRRGRAAPVVRKCAGKSREVRVCHSLSAEGDAVLTI